MSKEKNAEKFAINETLNHMYSSLGYLSRKEFLDLLVEWLDKRGVAPDVATGIDSNGNYQEVNWKEIPAQGRSFLDEVLSGKEVKKFYRGAKAKLSDGLQRASEELRETNFEREDREEQERKNAEHSTGKEGKQNYPFKGRDSKSESVKNTENKLQATYHGNDLHARLVALLEAKIASENASSNHGSTDSRVKSQADARVAPATRNKFVATERFTDKLNDAELQYLESLRFQNNK